MSHNPFIATKLLSDTNPATRPPVQTSPRRTRRLVFGCLMALTLIGVAGCRSSAYYEGSSKRTTGEITDDLRIQSSVKTKLIRHGETRGWRIDVDVFKGVVLLAGFVRSETERQTASDIARTTKGVQSVDNKLVIKGASQ